MPIIMPISNVPRDIADESDGAGKTRRLCPRQPHNRFVPIAPGIVKAFARSLYRISLRFCSLTAAIAAKIGSVALARAIPGALRVFGFAVIVTP